MSNKIEDMLCSFDMATEARDDAITALKEIRIELMKEVIRSEAWDYLTLDFRKIRDRFRTKRI